MKRRDPEVGRACHYVPSDTERPILDPQRYGHPLAATIVHVDAERGLVHLTVMDPFGVVHPRHHVVWVAPGTTRPINCAWAEYPVEVKR